MEKNHRNEQERYVRDIIYAARFWARGQPSGYLKVMKEYIENAKDMLHIFVSPEGIKEDDKEKLAAYRVLASQMGYEVGEYKFDKQTYIASAPIRKKK